MKECQQLFGQNSSTSVLESDGIEKAVTHAKEADVRKFLAEILRKDERLFARFQSFASHTLSREDMERYKNQVDATIEKYLGKERFISYQEASGFIREMEEFLGQDVRVMLDDGNDWEAFELTCHIFVGAGNVDMDDSNGGLGMLAGQCAEIWKEILGHADRDMQRKMYGWFTVHLDGIVIDYMEEQIEQVLMEGFRGKEYLEDMLAYTEQKAQEGKNGSNSWSAMYHAQKWTLRHIELMQECGFGLDSILQYCKGHWEHARVREYYIAKCMEQGSYDEAISVLKESLQMDSNMPGLVRSFSSRLKEAYRVSGRQEEYKRQLWELVTKDCAGDMDYFKELKSLYPADEWETVREKVFQALPPHAHVECLYKEEALYDRLLEYVLQVKGLYAMGQYQDVLEKDYPEQLLQKYADELNEMARCTADRRRYQEWAAHLRRMSKIKGGQEKVQEIVADWKVTYKNRPVMMEELKQLE